MFSDRRIPRIFIHTLIIVFVFQGGEPWIKEECVFFGELLEFVKCTMKSRSLASIKKKMQHLYACLSLMCSLHPLVWASSPESMRCFCFCSFCFFLSIRICRPHSQKAIKKHNKPESKSNLDSSDSPTPTYHSFPIAADFRKAFPVF